MAANNVYLPRLIHLVSTPICFKKSPFTITTSESCKSSTEFEPIMSSITGFFQFSMVSSSSRLILHNQKPIVNLYTQSIFTAFFKIKK